MNQGSDGPDSDQRGKLVAAGLSLLVVLLALSPITENWSKQPRDGFPLSYYPMFSRKRSATKTIYYVVALNKSGERITVPHAYFGPGGLNQTRRQLRRLVKGGRARELCQGIAETLARTPLAPNLVAVFIASGEYHLSDYFHGQKAPLRETVHAMTPIPAGEKE